MSENSPNKLFYGDNLDVLGRHVADESVDLVYLDPPFNSNANYNVLFAERDGTQAAAQIMTFDPIRLPDGTVRIDHLLPDTVEGREAARVIKDGSKSFLSAEFHSLSDAVISGVREIRASLVIAAALVGSGSYNQTRAEVRSRRKRSRSWL